MNCSKNKIEVFNNKADTDEYLEQNINVRPYVNVVTIIFIRGTPEMKGNLLYNKEVEKYEEKI